MDIEKIIQEDLEDRANQDSREQSLRYYYNNPNYCKYCGNIIIVDKNHHPSYARKRKFCSNACFYLYKQSIDKNYLCLNCKSKLNSTSKKYCSITCQCEYEQKVWEEKWFAGEVDGNKNSIWTQVSDRVKTYLFKKYNNKCSICGLGEVNPYTGRIPLEVEHIDGDPYNSTPENLTLLCPNCHSLTATYRGANRGNGRAKTWIPKPVEVEI